ncbi:ankyrin [Thozetella sp. PMI_491]|nr:ankyrin [Thozetella sp. PMI_491]
MAPDNLEMVKFLILHGAKVTESTIFATINAQNADALEFLMSNIADQAVGHSRARAPGLLPFYHGVQDTERNPLHFAAMEPSGNWHPLKRHFKGSAKSKEKFGALVRVLLRHGADPFAPCTVAPLDVDWNTVPSPQPQVTEQRTVLHSVLSSSFILEPFLEHPNLDLERRDKQGRTLLLAACSGRRGPDFRLTFPNGSLCSPRTTTILQFFMDRGADLLARDNKGRNLVHSIISRSDNSDVESLRLVLSKAPELLCQRDVHGDTPFHYAMSRIRAVPDIAKMLLDVGATPLELDSKGNTPLHNLAPWFLRADPVQTHTHVHATWLFGPDGVPEPQKPQTEASHIGRVEFFELLLRRGVHIDEPNPKTGNTPLFALMSDCYLEQSNSFVSRLPFSPSTARKYSSRPGHVSTNQPDALSDLEKEAFQLFEKAGANFFARNNEGATLLHVVARLPVYSANLDSKPEECHAAMAARFKYLLERGLDPMIEDKRQQTALDVAAATGNRHILQLFERQV